MLAVLPLALRAEQLLIPRAAVNGCLRMAVLCRSLRFGSFGCRHTTESALTHTSLSTPTLVIPVCHSLPLPPPSPALSTAPLSSHVRSHVRCNCRLRGGAEIGCNSAGVSTGRCKGIGRCVHASVDS